MKPAASTQPTTLREILRVVFLYRHLLLGTLCLFTAAAAAIAYLSPDEYLASVQLWVRDETAKLRHMGESPREQYERIQTAAANLREVALSRPVLSRVAVDLLQRRFEEAGAEERAKLLADIRERVQFEQRRSSEFGASQIVTIRVRHHDREFAGELLASLLKHTQEALAEAGRAHATKLVRTLERSFKERRAELDRAIAALDHFVKAVGVGIVDVQAAGGAPTGSSATVQALNEVERELATVTQRLATKQHLLRRVAALRQGNGEGAPEEFLQAYPELGRLQQALAEAEVQERTLQAIYTPNHPELLNARDRSAQLRHLYRERLAAVEASIGEEIEVLKGIRSDLMRRREKLVETLASFAGKYTEFLALKSEVDRKQEALREIEARLAQARLELAAAGQTTFFVPLGDVLVSERPVSVPDSAVAALGAGLGLLCGIGLAFLANYYSHTVRHETDLMRRGIGVPVLAAIPEVEEPLVFGRN